MPEREPLGNIDMRQITANGWQRAGLYLCQCCRCGSVRACSRLHEAILGRVSPGAGSTSSFNLLALTSASTMLLFTVQFAGRFRCLGHLFLCKDLWGKSAGLFAALFAAFSSSLISRTELGFFRKRRRWSPDDDSYLPFLHASSEFPERV